MLKKLLGIVDREEYKADSIEQIDKMTGLEFENFLYKLYESWGYKVNKTEALDDGLDLIIQKGKESIGIQAKRYTGKVEKAAVDTTYAAMRRRKFQKYNLNQVMIVTSGELTIPAHSAAKDLGVIVKTRQDVILEYVKDPVKAKKKADKEELEKLKLQAKIQQPVKENVEPVHVIKEEVVKLNNYSDKLNAYEEITELREQIKKVRKDLAEKHNIPRNKIYYVFNDETLEDLLKKKPRTLLELEGVQGFGKIKADKYGKKLIELFKNY